MVAGDGGITKFHPRKIGGVANLHTHSIGGITKYGGQILPNF